MVARLRKRQHKGLQHLQSVSLSRTKTFTRKWCKSRRRKKCCCSSLKAQLRGSLCLDHLFSHLSMSANRASVGSKHDKWHIEKVEPPSASFWWSTVGAYGNKNRDKTSGTLYFAKKKKGIGNLYSTILTKCSICDTKKIILKQVPLQNKLPWRKRISKLSIRIFGLCKYASRAS